jgi:hypothetical protein
MVVEALFKAGMGLLQDGGHWSSVHGLGQLGSQDANALLQHALW